MNDNIFKLEIVKINISGVEQYKDHKKNALNYFIYQLQDPFTFEICYIGQTDNPVRRYANHCNPNSEINNASCISGYIISRQKI